MKNIKVLYMIWKLNTGGAERMVVNYHNYLKNTCKGIEIKTLCFSRPCNGVLEKEIDSTDASVEYIPPFWGDKMPGLLQKVARKFFYQSFRKKWFLNEIENFSPDIIHIHLANLAAEFVDVCKGLPNSTKIIYHLHSMPETIGEKERKKITEAITTGLYHPLCVTVHQRLSAVDYYHLPINTSVIYNGINISKFTKCCLKSSEITDLKKQIGIQAGDFVIGAVGRGAPVKNYPFVAKVASIVGRIIKTDLLIVGDIPEELKQEIISESGKAKVIFVGQRVDTERMYRLMNVFLLASHNESSSIVTVEAQLSGVPCVISDNVSSEVVISNCVTRLSLDESPEKWAQCIMEIKDKKLDLVDEKRFDFNKSATELIQFYYSLIEG